MSQTNVQIVQEYIEEILNQKHFERFFEYCSQDCTVSIMPYVGVGIGTDVSSGEKIIINEVVPNGPADGQIVLGDQLVSVHDEQKVWATFDEIKNGIWGQGIIGSSITLTILRSGETISIPIQRNRIQAFNITLDPEKIKAWEKNERKEWKDIRSDIISIFASDDLVTCLMVNEGTNREYQRSAIWGECDLFRLENGKIVEMWYFQDSLSLLRQLGYAINEPIMEATS